MDKDELIDIWREVVLKNTTNGSCNFQQAAIDFAELVAEPWIETNKALAKEIIELKKQAEQEPVAWMQDRNDLYVADQRDKYYTVPLYAAPVRTKDPCNPLQDLTDEEIASIGSELAAKNCVSDIAFARAVIQEFRRKNGIV